MDETKLDDERSAALYVAQSLLAPYLRDYSVDKFLSDRRAEVALEDSE